MKLDNENAEGLLAIANSLIQSIKEYDRKFKFEKEEYHDCALTGYRDSAFGILFSLFIMNHITSGDFHRKVFDMDKAIYKKID